MKIRLVAMVLLIAVFFSSCSTMVRIETPDVQDASVKIDGERMGSTPVVKKLSNGIWNNYEVVVEKEGYRTYRGPLKKEVKVGNLIGGLFLFWPGLLWVYGPNAYQYIELDPEK